MIVWMWAKLGCDGMNSQVRKAMNVNYLSWNYNQMGVVATLKLSEWKNYGSNNIVNETTKAFDNLLRMMNCPSDTIRHDAAHRIHPLAGQGVNLGFGDVICLNEILGKAAYSGSKLNNLSYLKEYETERQRHNVPTMLAVEGLYRLYNTDFTPIVLLRSLGLQATHVLNPLKKVIISQASV
ncbi:unnamed protein product [Phaedon cochleariae]|uniref:FAD-binding domain-containing protein n=1 Tax=Phaedon cochleariae TaxID=80249 RepID=A0A9N9SAJ2_PHACE|nr:unnamed protein product [Phaedon cochleariae]